MVSLLPDESILRSPRLNWEFGALSAIFYFPCCILVQSRRSLDARSARYLTKWKGKINCTLILQPIAFERVVRMKPVLPYNPDFSIIACNYKLSTRDVIDKVPLCFHGADHERDDLLSCPSWPQDHVFNKTMNGPTCVWFLVRNVA